MRGTGAATDERQRINLIVISGLTGNLICYASPHKRQGGDADADARWENGAECLVAGVEGATGGEDVI